MRRNPTPPPPIIPVPSPISLKGPVLILGVGPPSSACFRGECSREESRDNVWYIRRLSSSPQQQYERLGVEWKGWGVWLDISTLSVVIVGRLRLKYLGVENMGAVSMHVRVEWCYGGGRGKQYLCRGRATICLLSSRSMHLHETRECRGKVVNVGNVQCVQKEGKRSWDQRESAGMLKLSHRAGVDGW